MDVEKELRKINFAELSRLKEESLRKILLVRQLQREKARKSWTKYQRREKLRMTEKSSRTKFYACEFLYS